MQYHVMINLSCICSVMFCIIPCFISIMICCFFTALAPVNNPSAFLTSHAYTSNFLLSFLFPYSVPCLISPPSRSPHPVVVEGESMTG